MDKGSLIGLVTAVVLASAGCGDDAGSGGAGGGGTTTTSGTTTSGATTTTGATTGSTTGATTGSTAATTTGGGTGATTAATGGGMAGFAEPCMSNADCESMVCHNFPNQGGMLCTLVCDGPEDCPPESSGCNNMGYCRPN